MRIEPHPADYDPGVLLTPCTIIHDLEPSEPIFVIRARDAFGVAMLNEYIKATDGLFSIDKMASLYALREQFRAFGQLRFPD